MENIQTFVEMRRQEIEEERLKLRDALSGSGGFTSPRAMEFMTAMNLRKIVLDEMERYGRFMADREPSKIEIPELTPRVATRRAKKETS